MVFTKTSPKLNLYYLFDRSDLLVQVMCVDALILTGSSEKHYFLGLEVWHSEGELFLKQGTYAIDILKRFQNSDDGL